MLDRYLNAGYDTGRHDALREDLRLLEEAVLKRNAGPAPSERDKRRS